MHTIAIILDGSGGELDRVTFETDDTSDVSEQLEEFLSDKILGPGDVIRIVDLDEEA